MALEITDYITQGRLYDNVVLVKLRKEDFIFCRCFIIIIIIVFIIELYNSNKI